MSNNIDLEEYLKKLQSLKIPPVDSKRHSWWIIFKSWFFPYTSITNYEWETICNIWKNTTCKVGWHSYARPIDMACGVYECPYCNRIIGPGV